MNVSGAVLRLWKAVPREVRLSFERHPVDDVRTLEAERDQLRRELERRESGVYGEMRDELVAELEKLEAERDRYRAALREAMELHRIAVVYVLAATPRTERTDYIDRLGALEALALTTSTQEPTVRFTNEGPPP